MVDIAVTAASVVKGTTATEASAIAGAAITAGEALYQSAADNRLYLADNNDTAAKAVFVGIALNDGAVGQPITYQSAGQINPGGTVVVGEIYVVSPNAGGIAPVGDLVSSAFVSIIGVGTTTSQITLRGYASGVQVP